MKVPYKFALLLAVCGWLWIPATEAQATALPAAQCGALPGDNCLQYSDFTVYSLPILNTIYNTTAYSVNSTYGQNKSNIILGINNGQSNNGALIDPAYNTPSANSISTFTNMTTDTGGTFGAGDGVGWDATVSSLKASLGSSSLVGFFAFNETGQNNLGGSDLLIWVHAQLRNLTTNAVQDFYLQPTGSTPNSNPDFVSTGGSMAPWTYVHGGVCTDSSGNFTGYPIDGSNGVCAVGTYHDQANLGQNNAAFAVYSDGLNQAVKNGDWDILHIDWKMDYLNGGGETAWIMPFDVQHSVPEPSTLLLMGAALIGLATSRRIRKN